MTRYKGDPTSKTYPNDDSMGGIDTSMIDLPIMGLVPRYTIRPGTANTVIATNGELSLILSTDGRVRLRHVDIWMDVIWLDPSHDEWLTFAEDFVAVRAFVGWRDALDEACYIQAELPNGPGPGTMEIIKKLGGCGSRTKVTSRFGNKLPVISEQSYHGFRLKVTTFVG